MKNATFKTTFEDLKISFRFAAKNIISYFLGIIGVLIVSGILLALVAIVIFVPAMLVVGFEAFVVSMEAFGLSMAEPGTTVIVGLVLLLSPLIAPFLVAIGALFGMGREIVESAGTTASGVLTWYKRKFFSLAGAGIILFFVVIGPVLLVLLLGALIYGDAFFNFTFFTTMAYDPVMSVGMALLTVWLVVSTGLFSMLFPAVIDGHSVIEATKRSLRMSIKYFDRIFGYWIAFLLTIVALVVPVIIGAMLTGPTNIFAMGLIAAYAIPMGLIIAFVAVPAMSIGLTRIYMILTADDVETYPEEEDDSRISFVGGL
ncbi:hypothetical protein EU524_01615 [Candidatus Thorarchaeota archaeon]|nr:MAG: hypothetical protein EU524_01615 [Candidatus Thorarchaeota archaeon]